MLKEVKGKSRAQASGLKYVFQANFEDGTSLCQGADDASVFDKSRSAFFDLLKLQEENPLNRIVDFHLIGEGHDYSVWLTDGHFEVDGLPLWVGHELAPHTSVAPLKLIYYRQTQFNVTINPHTQEELGREQTVRHCIGWECTVASKTGPRKLDAIFGVF